MKKLIVPTIVLLALVAFYFLNSLTAAPIPILIVASETQLKTPLPSPAGSPPSSAKEPDETSDKSTEELLALTVNCRTRMVPITPFMYREAPDFATICSDIPDRDAPRGHRETFVSEQNVWITMYLSENAFEGFKNNAQQFPAGTVVIKEKLWKDPLGNPRKVANLKDKVVLYTGMLKREKGFNPKCGDWEFFTVSGDGSEMTLRGKLANCIDCHKNYANTDYVVSRYSPPPELLEKK